MKRKRYRKMIAVFAALLVLTAAGCTDKKNESSKADSRDSSEGAKVTPGKVELKTYEFPRFLVEGRQPDMLTRAVFSSFRPEDHLTELPEQPFEGYECTGCIDGALYIFEEGRFKGLLNASGYVVLEADTYTDIQVCGPGLIALSRDREESSPDDYANYNNVGGITMVGEQVFDTDRIYQSQSFIYDSESSGEETVSIWELMVDGTPVGELSGLGSFLNIEQVSPEDIDTAKTFSECYRVFTDKGYYFVAIDRYYNFTVYEGAYAYVRLRVGEDYGECYILDSDDNLELMKMIESFGDSTSARLPNKDPALDYIQIETGLGGADRVTVTISADGFCLTDESGSGKQNVDKYFTCYDKESFVSLVLWTDQVLSKEYE